MATRKSCAYCGVHTYLSRCKNCGCREFDAIHEAAPSSTAGQLRAAEMQNLTSFVEAQRVAMYRSGGVSAAP